MDVSTAVQLTVYVGKEVVIPATRALYRWRQSRKATALRKREQANLRAV